MKKIMYTLAVLVLVVTITGCGSKKEKKSNNETMTIEDKNNGFKTTFTYPKDKKFEIEDAKEEGKYKEVIIKNTDKNIKMDLYYFEIYDSSFESAKESRSNSDNYKEYTWNGYKGYIYNGNKYSLLFNILLKGESDGKMGVGLFGSVDYLDYNSANVLESFNSSDIQDLLNTIKFEKID